jgi:hypothetical protein
MICRELSMKATHRNRRKGEVIFERALIAQGPLERAGSHFIAIEHMQAQRLISS